MFMRCRVTIRTILALRSTTKEEWVMEAIEVAEEVEDLVEVANKSIATAADNRDTMQETIPTPPQYVSIANPMIILLKTALFYKLSGKKIDHRWEIRIVQLIGVEDRTPEQKLNVVM